MAKEKVVGEITHYFSKIGVAVVKVKSNLKVGDKVKIKGATTDFEQEINSMQLDHDSLGTAKKGDEIGLKVDEHVREGDCVYSE